MKLENAIKNLKEYIKEDSINKDTIREQIEFYDEIGETSIAHAFRDLLEE